MPPKSPGLVLWAAFLPQNLPLHKGLSMIKTPFQPQLLSIVLLGFAGSLQASGFALIEQSASGQGLSYAGSAANTEDASVMWFNAAGISDVGEDQFIAGLHVISPNATFNNQGSYIKAPSGPLYGIDGNGAKTGYVPNFFWKSTAGDLDVGLGVNVPYGSTVEYDQFWVGRYHAVKTQTQSINLNPSLSRKFGEHLSVGLGLNAQYIRVNLTQKIDFALSGTPQTNDGYADLEATSWSYGYNLGVLYQLSDAAKIGLSYRSGFDHKASGTADFTTPSNITNAAYSDSNITAAVSLPAVASLSYVMAINDTTELLADASWTGWSSFKELRIDYANAAKDDSVQPEQWKDVMRYALGASHQLNDQLKLRTGIAYDSTPIPDKTLRTPRIPDSDRIWLSAGLGYALTANMNLDLAYSYLHGGRVDIQATDSDTSAHVLQGTYDTSVNIFSAQLVWNY